MNFRHAAALALVGWYLMAPPSISSLAASAKSKLSTYTNRAYGFSFRYPSDWSLKEGGEAELNFGYLGQVEDSLPHGVTVAAVQVALDLYRGTDLGITGLIVSVDTTITDALCNEGSPRVKVGAIEFTEWEGGDIGMGHQSYCWYYRVFRNRACYEFVLGESQNYSDATTHLNDDSVFRKLKAILATVKFQPATLAPQRLKSN